MIFGTRKPFGHHNLRTCPKNPPVPSTPKRSNKVTKLQSFPSLIHRKQCIGKEENRKACNLALL